MFIGTSLNINTHATTKSSPLENTNQVQEDTDIQADMNLEPEMKLSVHSDIYCAVNGKAINITGCVLKDDRVFVPVKPVFEAMGYTVKYNAQKQTLQITSKTNSSNVLIDLTKSIVSGVLSDGTNEVEIASIIEDSCTVNGISYIPIRSIGDNLYCDVEWNQSTQTVFISSPKIPVEQDSTQQRVSTLAEVGVNATDYYKDFISSLKVLTSDEIKKLWSESLVTEIPITTSDPTTELESETNRVIQDFLAVLLESHNNSTGLQMTDNSTDWNAQKFVGYNAYNGHLAEVERLLDRLTSEKVLTEKGKQCVLDKLGQLANSLH